MMETGFNNYRKASVEEMNKLILEKVPLEERLRAVYLPIFVIDCACYVGESLLQSLRELKLDSTKKSSREIKECIEGYRKENSNVMRSDLYKQLSHITRDFYDCISKDILILQMQYQQELLNRNIILSAEKSGLIAKCSMMDKILVYAVNLDRQFSKQISDLLGERVVYTTKDNRYCLRIMEAIYCIKVALDVPLCAFELVSDKIDLAFKIFQSKVSSLKFDMQ